MKKIILSLSILGAVALTGCTTNRYGEVESVGCDTGTNYGGAAAGGYAGSKSGIGCRR